jgi:hypothetical protein
LRVLRSALFLILVSLTQSDLAGSSLVVTKERIVTGKVQYAAVAVNGELTVLATGFADGGVVTTFELARYADSRDSGRHLAYGSTAVRAGDRYGWSWCMTIPTTGPGSTCSGSAGREREQSGVRRRQGFRDQAPIAMGRQTSTPHP